MNTEVTQSASAVACYVQGRKDGFASGVIFAAAAVIFWKAYKRGRDGETLLSKMKFEKK